MTYRSIYKLYSKYEKAIGLPAFLMCVLVKVSAYLRATQQPDRIRANQKPFRDIELGR